MSFEALREKVAIGLLVARLAFIMFNFYTWAPSCHSELHSHTFVWCMLSIQMLYAISTSIASIPSTHVCFELGARRPNNAKGTTIVPLLINVLEGVVTTLLFVLNFKDLLQSIL